jgi:hypothetical protein
MSTEMAGLVKQPKKSTRARQRDLTIFCQTFGAACARMLGYIFAILLSLNIGMLVQLINAEIRASGDFSLSTIALQIIVVAIIFVLIVLYLLVVTATSPKVTKGLF